MLQLFSMALKIGDKAPEFTLKDSFNNEISLSDFKGKKSNNIFLSER